MLACVQIQGALQGNCPSYHKMIDVNSSWCSLLYIIIQLFSNAENEIVLQLIASVFVTVIIHSVLFTQLSDTQSPYIRIGSLHQMNGLDLYSAHAAHNLTPHGSAYFVFRLKTV